MKPTTAFIAGCVCGLCICQVTKSLFSFSPLSRSAPRASPELTEIMRDTVVVRDTIRIPSPAAKSTVRVRCDTVFLPTVSGDDTVATTLPISQVHYSLPQAQAWVSGYRPRLDSLLVFPESATISRTLVAPPPRWSISVSAGLAISPKGISPAITVGISYSIINL